MRYSNLFPKTFRQPPADASTASHRLLVQAGFIKESVAGRYFFLPLGIRVKNKIMQIVREEMNASGAQEMVTPTLHPLELWKETNRTESAGFELMQLKDRRGAEFALGGTAEEMVVDMVRGNQISYKELPFNLYQFSTKFRDELRARGGLLRVREFTMKDAYSFDVGEEAFQKEYENMWQTYARIYARCGLETSVVESDGGYIGGDYCHEFVVEHEVGETTYLITEDGAYAAHEDVAVFTHRKINLDEEMKPLETIEQPQWVKTMQDNEKHYGLPAERFLKNVVYKTSDGRLVIGVVRGDLEVNPVKLQRIVDSKGELEPATEEDLTSIGTKPGYVHSWGHEGVTYVADLSLKTVHNFIGGQKENTTDTTNVNYGRDFEHQLEGDIALATENCLSVDGKPLFKKVGIEVGNIFQLGHHYSKPMNANYTAADGTQRPFYMGCYGIGIGRTLAAVVEIHHDKQGIVWPEALAPFQVHLISLGKDDEVKKEAEELYQKLLQADIEVLFDDRAESPGVKFSDSDLIGLPYRVVVSARNLKEGKLEVKKRNEEGKGELMTEEKLFRLLKTTEKS